jgi:hypothetical protein
MGNGDIFISHSHIDRDTAWRLAHDLMDQRFAVWLDRLEIELSEDWPNELEVGIDSASVVLVVWNKNAKESKWVAREIARADRRNTPIVPLVFDDTDVDIHLERRQFVDFRKGWFVKIQELFVFLNQLAQQEQGQGAIIEQPWQRVPDPDLRNRFLHANHYSTAVTSDDFGRNEWTNRLRNIDASSQPLPAQWLQASQFVSIVSIPLDPSRLAVDFNELRRYLGKLHDPNSGTRSLPSDAPPQRRFPLGSFDYERDQNNDYIRFNATWGNRESGDTGIIRFLRMSQGGGIEFCDSVYLIQTRNASLVVLNYVGVLGATWQLVHFVSDIYADLLGYVGNIQILVNVAGVEGGLLDNLAKSSGGKEWSSPLDHAWSLTAAQSRCGTKNIQIVYDFDSQAIRQSDTHARCLMEDLGFEIQRCFDLTERRPYHYIPDTEDFPWQQYFGIWK